MTNYYRRKDNPRNRVELPPIITYDGMTRAIPQGADLEPEFRVAIGYYLDIPQNPGEGYQLGDVVTWDEAAGTVTMNVVAIPDTSAATLQAQLRQIQQGRRQWLDDNIDPDGLQLAMMLYQQGNAKGAAIFQWCVSLGRESKRRQETLEAGLIAWDDTLMDFSVLGPKPHSIDELMAEAGL